MTGRNSRIGNISQTWLIGSLRQCLTTWYPVAKQTEKKVKKFWIYKSQTGNWESLTFMNIRIQSLMISSYNIIIVNVSQIFQFKLNFNFSQNQIHHFLLPFFPPTIPMCPFLAHSEINGLFFFVILTYMYKSINICR